MDLPEQLATQPLFDAVAMLAADAGEQFIERSSRGTALFTERSKRIAAFRDDAVAPPFGVGKDTLYLPVAGGAGCNGAPHRLRVASTHQFSDQLFLPTQRTVGAHLRRGQRRFAQPFVNGQRVQLLHGKVEKLLAELLQFQLLSFSRRFAGL